MLKKRKSSYHSLRDTITKAYRMDETECVNHLISYAAFPENTQKKIAEIAQNLVQEARIIKKKQGKIDELLHQYDLSTDEGIALMCLAEALLRVPDKGTMDKLISDKLSTVNWQEHISKDQSFFINATSWSLLLTGKLYAPALSHQETLLSALKRAGSRLGAAMIRPIILKMMKTIGNQFILSQDIHSAQKNGKKLEEINYLLSYDMLGEAARTAQEATRYFELYENAIEVIGKNAKSNNPTKNPGISVKLSALHPRYDYTQADQVIEEVAPLLLKLAQHAKAYQIGLTVDAEEADRLDLSLDIFEAVYRHSSLSNWEGLGLAIQAYQKRAFYVIDWLAELVKQEGRRLMVRLVKGAYWDAEIKLTQIQGLNDYPVFTRKASTDVSFLACAKKLLASSHYFYSQFGTHNAYSVAAIMTMATGNVDFEFQCLHGMGRYLYDQIVDKTKYNIPTRIYAPIGTHVDLLGYLVRRLLENGANSSFINRLANDKIPIEKIIADPFVKVASLPSKPHPHIPKPRLIYKKWLNAKGIDLSDPHQLKIFSQEVTNAEHPWFAGSMINGKYLIDKKGEAITSPTDPQLIIGYVTPAKSSDVEEALNTAQQAAKHWAATSAHSRADILEKAASAFEAAMPQFIAIISREGGRCLLDCISEVRETVDYCRYYAYRARQDLVPISLPGPTGETNQLTLHPRGIIACISPWNFPLAIFTGQILAALVTGNAVLAKPAEQTPLVAYHAIKLLHEAGVPKEVLQLIIGPGSEVGAKIVNDARISGVIFTGSTETAKKIEQALAKRQGSIAMFIAETGGQNAMIVDSSALLEQVVIDIVQSAFNSAGQRCSALRVLFVQEEIAQPLLRMLSGYMEELIIGDPRLLSTDIGPVIDSAALAMLQKHYAYLMQKGKLIAQVPLHKDLRGYFFSPCAFEINDLSILKGEVFGPVLHVIRYSMQNIHNVMEEIIKTGFGLTLGIHSRIDSTVRYIAERMPIGNIYVNRNMIGAVVGVQPFGGEHLSGTGPKAGGPHYLPRLCVERVITTNTTALGGNARLVSLLEEEE